ncbi:MAG: hypothetical protein EOM20_17155 [Spartobacteria bacterium]|nr:hypothetical protein [Spartobacteria bacterium]
MLFRLQPAVCCSGFSLPRTASSERNGKVQETTKKYDKNGCFSMIFVPERARLAVRGRLKPEQRAY